MIAGCEIFPSNSIFNSRIDDLVRFPADARSNTWIANIGPSRPLHMDFGRNENQADPSNYFGIPYNIVDSTAATTIWPTVSFEITDPRAGNGNGEPGESDCAAPNAGHTITRDCRPLAPADRHFPFPNDNIIKAEFGTCNDAQSCGDRHVLVVEQGACRLWESYFSYKVSTQWFAYSTAAWDLRSNQMRPSGWTSGDAAGLPILPLLVREDEASAGAITHAFRVTFADSLIDRRFVWPARHAAGGATPGGIPYGAVMRLKSDFPIPDSWSPQSRAVALAMKRYGVYVADIGSSSFITGEPSARWSATAISELQRIQMSSFEFVDIGAITSHPQFDSNSFRAAW